MSWTGRRSDGKVECEDCLFCDSFVINFVMSFHEFNIGLFFWNTNSNVATLQQSQSVIIFSRSINDH